MAFDPGKFFIEDWLHLEKENLLQKVCNQYAQDGILIGQYLTRLTVVPSGGVIPHGGGRGRLNTGASPALYRSFTYDVDGNQVASLPEMREWTQACEDAAEGIGGEDPIDIILPGTAGTPKIYHVSMPLANTEYSQLLVDGTKKIKIRLQDKRAKLQYAFVSGDSSILYSTLPKGNSYWLDGVTLVETTVYLQSDKPNQLVEIEEWS